MSAVRQLYISLDIISRELNNDNNTPNIIVLVLLQLSRYCISILVYNCFIPVYLKFVSNCTTIFKSDNISQDVIEKNTLSFVTVES